MIHATRNIQPARQAGSPLKNLVQSLLIAMSLVSVAVAAEDRPQPSAISFLDTRLDVAAQTHAGFTRISPEVLNLSAVPKHLPGSIQLMPDEDSEEGLSLKMERVRDWVARRYQVSVDALEPVLAAAEEAGRNRGIDPLLIVAIMAIESGFNPRAVSGMGAQGLMQVIPRYHQDKIGSGRGKNALFDPEFNVHVGTQVLHEGLQRYGSLQQALQYYNGSMRDPLRRYTRKVMAVQRILVAVASGQETTAAS
jgi:hypothetical protein